MTARPITGQGPECWDEFGKWVNPGPVECASVYPPDWPLVSVPAKASCWDLDGRWIMPPSDECLERIQPPPPVPNVVITVDTTAAPSTTQPSPTTLLTTTTEAPATTAVPTTIGVILSDGPLPPAQDTSSSTSTTVAGITQVMPPFISPDPLTITPSTTVVVPVATSVAGTLPTAGAAEVLLILGLVGAALGAAGGLVVRGVRG